MKNLFTFLFFCFIALSAFAQAPQKFSYQTVVRNASNQLLVGQTVGIKISILQGSANGSAVYTETHAPQTNANGLATLEIGGGSLLSGNFANINWANGPFFVKTETDPNGGNNYTITNTSQLLSVPYALYAATAGNNTPGPQGPAGQNGVNGQNGLSAYQIWLNAGNSGSEADFLASLQGPQGNPATDDQSLSVSLTGDTLFLQNGGFVIIPGISAANNGGGGQTGIIQHTCGADSIHNHNKTYGIMTDQEGNVYKTIVIGNQEWMAENLNTSTYRNGDQIQTVIPDPQFVGYATDLNWLSLTIGAWCYYNNDTQYECPFGKLYNWYSVSDPRNLCPIGWHVPTDVEWTTLTDYLGGEEIAGNKMKSESNDYSLAGTSGGATNESGFSGLLGGLRDGSSGGIIPDGYLYNGYLWSSSESSNMNAWCRNLYFTTEYVGRFDNYKLSGFSVRCLKDSSLQQGSINIIDCGDPSNIGSLTLGEVSTGVNSTIFYSGGNGGSYISQTVTSTGVTGLTATLTAGTFATGAGNLTYTISGTPASSGIAIFTLSIGGQTCELTRTVNLPAYTITALNCANANNSGTLTQGTAVSNVSISVPYTGGNGGTHSGQTVTSTGVTGLTATLEAGTLLTGAGSLTYNITGSPTSSGSALFQILIGAFTCSVSFEVNSSGGGTPATCGAVDIHNSVLTNGTLIDQEGNVYKTIVIGSQEWMAENLKSSIYRNGEPIANVIYNAQWVSLNTGAWCNYNNNYSFDCPYGKLYNWYAVADPRNLCPSYWHVPTDAEWTTLTTFLDSDSVAGVKMKSSGTQYWYSGNGASNEIGFSGLPGGYRVNGNGFFYYVGFFGSWWSSSESSASEAWFRSLSLFDGNASRIPTNKQIGFSVRCLKD